MTSQSHPRVLNLTPHAVHIYHNDSKEPLIIPSDGELRLHSRAMPQSTVSHIHPLHYYRAADARGAMVEAAIPVIPAQVFNGLDETSPGFKHIKSLTEQDSIIVSIVVAQWLARTAHPGNILSPGTGPTTVVRYEDDDPSRRGQIKGVRALEYHPKLFSQ